MNVSKDITKELEQLRHEFRVGFVSDDGSQRQSNASERDDPTDYGDSPYSGGGSTSRWFTTFRKAISSKSESIRSRSHKSAQYPFRSRGRSESKSIAELVLLSNSQDSQFSDTAQSAFSENSQIMPVSPLTTVTVPHSNMTDSIPKLQIEDYIAPQPGLQLSTISYEGQSDDEAGGDLNDILDQLKQMDEYFSNVDVSHVGAKLLDREDLDFLCNASVACPHVPAFHSIFSNFSAVMPEPKQVHIERDIEQEEAELLSDLLKEAAAQMSGEEEEEDEEEDDEADRIEEDTKSSEAEQVDTNADSTPVVTDDVTTPTNEQAVMKEVEKRIESPSTRQETEADDEEKAGDVDTEVESVLPDKPSEDAAKMTETTQEVTGVVEDTETKTLEESQPPANGTAISPSAAKESLQSEGEPSVIPEQGTSAPSAETKDYLPELGEIKVQPTVVDIDEKTADASPAEPEPPKETTVNAAEAPLIEPETLKEVDKLSGTEEETSAVVVEKVLENEVKSAEVADQALQRLSEKEITKEIAKETATKETDASPVVTNEAPKDDGLVATEEVSVTPKAIDTKESLKRKDSTPKEGVTEERVSAPDKLAQGAQSSEDEVSTLPHERNRGPEGPIAEAVAMSREEVLPKVSETFSEGLQDQSEVASVEETQPESTRSDGQMVVRIPVFESPSPTSAAQMICGSVLGSVQSTYCLSSPRWSPSLVGPDGFNQTCSRVRLECNQDVRALWLVGAQFESMLGQMLSSNASLRGQMFIPLQPADMRRLAIKMSVELGGLVERGEESPSADGRKMEDSTEKAHAYARRHSAPALSYAVRDWAREVYCASMKGRPNAAAFNRPLRSLREIRDWAENYEADRRWEWNKSRLRHSQSRESSSSYSPLEKVRLRQGERQARLGRDAYHEETERRFQAQLEAVRARMRRAAAKKGKTLSNPAQQTIREIVYESKGSAAIRKPSLTGTKISTVKANEQLTTPAQPVPPKRHQLPPRTTPNAPTISASPPEQTTDFRHVLRRTGRLEALRAGRLNAPVEKAEPPAQPAKAILVHKAIKPSDARDMFERKAREQAKSGEAPSEWFLKQVSKYQKV